MLNLSIENNASDCLTNRLKNVCLTRWVEQVTGLNEFEDLIPIALFRTDEFE